MRIFNPKQLLPEDSSREQIQDALVNLGRFKVGRIADVLKENDIKRFKKVQNITFIIEQPEDEIIAAYNTVVSVRNVRISKVKQLYPLFLAIVKFVRDGVIDGTLKEKVIEGIKKL